MDKGNKKEKLIVQGICLLLSIVLWFYVSNVENSTRTIDVDAVPVKLVGTEDLESMGLALVSESDFKVNIKVEGQSSEIYKISKENFVIEANLADYALKKGENRIPVKVVDYPSSINIKNTANLNIKVILDEYKEKVVPVKTEINVKTTSGHFAGTPQLSDQDVVVSGPAVQVEKVDKVIARGIIENVSSDITKSYNLICIDVEGQEIKNVKLSKESVDVSIHVSKGRTIPIKVITKGSLVEGKVVSLTPSITTVEINGPEELTKGINEITTSAINLASISESGDVNVNLILPDGVKVPEGKDVITVKVEIQKTTVKDISAPVNVIGKVEGYNYVLSTEEVKIRISDFEEKLQSIKAENFTVEIDVTGLTEGEHNLIPKITVKGNGDIAYEVLNNIKVTITKI